MTSQRLILAGGLNWNIVEAGQGPVVLLVHGTAASVHSWRDVIPLLAKTHRVIAMDLPGHGGTKHRSSSDLSLDSMGKGVVALTKALGLSPSIVVGHSAGAAILAWACAHRHLTPETYVSFNGAFYPFAGIAGSLFSPIAKFIAINPLVPRLVSSFASRTKVEKLLQDTGSTISPEGVEFYYNLYKDPSHVAAALGMMAAWDLRGMDDNLVRIDAECVFVAGGGDKAVPPETAARAAARCRKARHLQIEGFGHLLHEENPQRAADIIRGQIQ
jgi:magnesium chelatase accessory protein